MAGPSPTAPTPRGGQSRLVPPPRVYCVCPARVFPRGPRSVRSHVCLLSSSTPPSSLLPPPPFCDDHLASSSEPALLPVRDFSFPTLSHHTVNIRTPSPSFIFIFVLPHLHLHLFPPALATMRPAWDPSAASDLQRLLGYVPVILEHT